MGCRMRPEILAKILADHIVMLMKDHMGPISQRLSALETQGSPIVLAQAAIEQRMAALEARAPEPGPPGPPGPAGLDGAPGLAGKDGAPGLSYCGVYVRGKEYDTGEIVTAGGSAFHCNRLTTAAPGSSSDWTLMVKRGQDGKDTGGRS
jgi:hypothetical protein